MRSVTLDLLTDSFRQGDNSEEGTFVQIWIIKTEHLKTWDQKIYVIGTASIKLMQGRVQNFINSAKKQN